MKHREISNDIPVIFGCLHTGKQLKIYLRRVPEPQEIVYIGDEKFKVGSVGTNIPIEQDHPYTNGFSERNEQYIVMLRKVDRYE